MEEWSCWFSLRFFTHSLLLFSCLMSLSLYFFLAPLKYLFCSTFFFFSLKTFIFPFKLLLFSVSTCLQFIFPSKCSKHASFIFSDIYLPSLVLPLFCHAQARQSATQKKLVSKPDCLCIFYRKYACKQNITSNVNPWLLSKGMDSSKEKWKIQQVRKL